MNNITNKYIFEDNMDFKKELEQGLNIDGFVNVNVNENVNENGNGNGFVDEELCKISHEKLTKSHITLPCNHKFNYIHLFKEICLNKEKKNIYEVNKLEVNQIKCPYCRDITNKLLPFIPSEYSHKIHGVNSPLIYCMENNVKCDWLHCNKESQYISENSYCKKHYVLNNKKLNKHKVAWTKEMTTMYKEFKILKLKQFLRLHKLKVSGNKRDLIERIAENNLNIVKDNI